MAGRIPRDFIDDLIARSDIVDIVDNRVKLKKAGRNYQACCPFHNEKTPSFSVSPDKQFYHCFGCGEHGNALSFIMEFDRLEFVEAVEELARYHGVEVPRENTGKPHNPAESQRKKQQLDDDYALMEKAAKYFQYQLRNHPQKQQIIDYLKNRDISGATVKDWEIGFAPDEWQGLADRLAVNAHATGQCLDLKLMTKNDNGKTFDFFRNRLMFPIRDRRGRVIGFGGRVIESDDNGPKYLNSPETRIFFKGSELYGLYRARQLHRNLRRLVVVEGYMDVVALSQFGIDYAVASLGTSTTPEHVQLMLRNTDEIVCCYDGDKAGRSAAWRTLENALPQLKDGKIIKFMFLPDGEDPDTMVRQVGKEALEEMFDKALPLSQFLFNNLIERHDISTGEGKAAFKKEASPLIEAVAGDNLKEILAKELAKYMGNSDEYQLQVDMAKAKQNKRPRKIQYQTPQKLSQSPVRMMLRLLLEHPPVAVQANEVNPLILADTGIAGIDILNQVFTYCQAKPHANTALLFENFKDAPFIQHLTKLLQSECLVQPEDYATVYRDCFSRLISQYLDARKESLIAKSRGAGLTQSEKEELNKLLLQG
ncbi:DNA primase [Opacimonas viscosa]|uniref:DNA primase n=1 Tax=Opacimonas viscosa TaxID=2961944 RepID=A0AA42BLS4_9ALTE|nr:DNA primase [Opacimonas viscosa]MCP3427867.1 DNA primase [Opacimonas viscosa]